MGGSLLMLRLVRTYTTSQLRALNKRNIRLFGTGPKGGNDNGGHTDAHDPSTPDPGLTRGSQFGRRRPLSPLERVSQLLPQDSLSPEVEQLRGQNQEETERVGEPPPDQNTLDVSVTAAAPSANTHVEHNPAATRAETPDSGGEYARADALGDGMSGQGGAAAAGAGGGSVTPTLPGERPLAFGELILAEYRRRRRVEYRKMFPLKEGERLHSSWGTVAHGDVAGGPAGGFMRTTRGTPIFVRRPSLEEYVLYMKRGPAIAYPKDASTMLMMMDVTEGDSVLESGSGSGAMSLFLSRAVGSKGRVVSVEIREDHHRRAVLNYQRWRSAWALRRGEEWPDNVQFHNADLQTAASLLTGRGFHSIALDMIRPHMVLPTVTPHLHPGAVCAVYLANITQVIDLLEGLRCSALPLLCERIIEVQLRDWLLAPALQKDGAVCPRNAPPSEGHAPPSEGHAPPSEGHAPPSEGHAPPSEGHAPPSEGRHDDETTEMADEPPPFGSIPYIARPHPEQLGHTAFLVKLRKCVR